MSETRLITLAIHTFERAHRMKSLLESHGVKTVLQNVNLTSPSVSSGVRVRIAESDLPYALRIVENVEIFSPEVLEEKKPGQTILVPVDFSDCSFRATLAAFRLASIHNASVHLLHSYIDPTYSARAAMQLSDTLDFESSTDMAEDVIMEKEISAIAARSMKDFEARVLEKIKSGVIPVVRYDSETLEGLPEETIANYTSEHHPILIVMGTNGTDQKSRHLFGSVTGEVLDSCRVTILTMPENITPYKTGQSLHTVFFATSTQDDILTLDALYRLMPEIPLTITIVCLPDKGSDQGATNLLNYCKEHYPAYRFTQSTLSLSNPLDDYDRISAESPVDMIVVGTRKRNIFARLFSPTLAHRLLFHADTRLLSIPV